jgi:GLPGLI family protein
MFCYTRLHFSTFVLLILLSSFTKAQTSNTEPPTGYLRAIYQVNYKIDSAVTEPKTERMILRISNNISCYKSLYKHVHDSVYASANNLPYTARANAANNVAMKTYKAAGSESNYSIFKEVAKGNLFYCDNIRTIPHQYQENPALFHWRITPNKKEVAGYDCQQAFAAFGGRTWEAWFARAIPVSDGPYKFYGLPGLIVQVRDTHDNYVFELLSLDSHPAPFSISAISSAPLIKKARFKEAKLNDDLTLVDQMASWGNQIPESMRTSYLAKLKRRNNPLELK